MGALAALDNLTGKRQGGHSDYGVAADLTGCCANREHDWRLGRVAARSEERASLGLIRQWGQAGILDTPGALSPPVTGPPQGGVVSAVLSTGSRPYGLDWGFEQGGKPQGRGEACRRRYAAAYGCAGEDPGEAERVYAALGPRLEQLGRTLAAEQTRGLPCSRPPAPGQSRFECLGGEVRWGQERAGTAPRQRRPARPQLRASLPRFAPGCRQNGQLRRRGLFKQVNVNLRGDDPYSGGHGNRARRQHFFAGARRRRLKGRNGRSQRRSYHWPGFTALVEHCKGERQRLVGQPKTRRATAMA